MTFNLFRWSARGVRLTPQQVAEAGWIRMNSAKSQFGQWRHQSGWTVSHCGHPTALWPYALYNPENEMVCTGVTCAANPDPANGTAWPNLASAMMYVASLEERA